MMNLQSGNENGRNFYTEFLQACNNTNTAERRQTAEVSLSGIKRVEARLGMLRPLIFL
ncbi:hypothetical protein RY831_29340 [Noviherbaspirillum sp. CPCC 100848]|uniref:Uncharacterized protein n=1 Tax=Noviherbaspirillum album TaxID=3080276 RepID=A0ABU6JHX4_9BURK|nr:hypothetical protein [Noviherbaspirillum sp. CPCC 100848]